MWMIRVSFISLVILRPLLLKLVLRHLILIRAFVLLVLLLVVIVPFFVVFIARVLIVVILHFCLTYLFLIYDLLKNLNC